MVESARTTAEAVDSHLSSPVTPFGTGTDLLAEATARRDFAEKWERCGEGSLERAPQWLERDPDAWTRALARLASVGEQRQILEAAPPDPELDLAYRNLKPDWNSLQADLRGLEEFEASLKVWYGFVQFGARKAGREIVTRYGLRATAEDAGRLRAYLGVRKAAHLVADVVRKELPLLDRDDLADVASLVSLLGQHGQVLELLVSLASTPLLQPVTQVVRPELASGRRAPALVEALKGAIPVARAVADFEAALAACSVIRSETRTTDGHAARNREPVSGRWRELEQGLGGLETVLRIDDTIRSLPPEVGGGLRRRLLASCDPTAGWTSLIHRVARDEMQRRVAAAPDLLAIDGDRLQSCQGRYLKLTWAKQKAVLDHIVQRWVSKQRSRLLASTANRLNSAGAELKRRLLVRGANSLRLRQVVAAGRAIEGGDPLFDLRPVWMASPDTVALVFPREPVFDVVIFDEASQCRLEEALPVLTRARRVVIAGDPRQLPPTRFFEAAVVESGETDAETEQDLFEIQQGEVEDLLSAALNIEIEQAYLDVHYRSQNSALIEFSNDNFYESRLQPIPGHPRNRAMIPPIRLQAVAGVYEKRVNRAEAAEVVRIVQELLRRAEPPSIGVACFNMAQRDVLLEVLDAAANEDPEFAARLSAARSRRGKDSFEGLFVKNLENVQGDERDVIVISTTFGPDAKGRFYRRFGPLGMVGGGRRLNVLVTRARCEVILVTSIPSAVYRVETPPPTGRSPNGAWFLFEYLRYAEKLARLFEEDWERRKHAVATAVGEVKIYGTEHPSSTSAFAEGLALHLAQRQGISSEVYWGSEGFCIDVALSHPMRPEDVTIGLLVDGVRYHRAPDPAEWDAFRTAVLESQGWAIERIWTPHFVRNPDAALERIEKRVKVELDKEQAAFEPA